MNYEKYDKKKKSEEKKKIEEVRQHLFQWRISLYEL
jgi:hypothetical protein